MCLCTWSPAFQDLAHLSRYHVLTHAGGTKKTSEQFNTAGRSVKTGLIANVIVSQWTWAATLLQSSNVAYKYGVAGPFWYAAGATVQVLLFGILAVQVVFRSIINTTFFASISL